MLTNAPKSIFFKFIPKKSIPLYPLFICVAFTTAPFSETLQTDETQMFSTEL